VRGGAGFGQPADRRGLFGGGQGVLTVPEIRQHAAEVIQHRGEVGQVRGGGGLGQPPEDRHGVFGGGQGVRYEL
jgi:hypothetical protein